MSPVSRKRKRVSPPPAHRARGAVGARRRMPALDVLTRELAKLREVTDAFVVEGIATYLLDVIDLRGPHAAGAFETFSRECVDDPRAGTSLLGLQAMAVLAELGHPAVRGEAAVRVAAADAELVAELPGWHRHLGQVHVVEAAVLRTADATESVVHVLLDYDEPGAGSRHLLTAAIEHRAARVHLLDVRGRQPSDVLAPVAAGYADSVDPVWSWVSAADLAPVVVEAVRETARHSAEEWPLLDVEGGHSVCWTLGTRRLERLTGVLLPATEPV